MTGDGDLGTDVELVVEQVDVVVVVVDDDVVLDEVVVVERRRRRARVFFFFEFVAHRGSERVGSAEEFGDAGQREYNTAPALRRDPNRHGVALFPEVSRAIRRGADGEDGGPGDRWGHWLARPAVPAGYCSVLYLVS